MPREGGIPRPDDPDSIFRHGLHCDHWIEPFFHVKTLYSDTIFCFAQNGFSTYPTNPCAICNEYRPCRMPNFTNGQTRFNWAYDVGTLDPVPVAGEAAYFAPFDPNLPDLIGAAWQLLVSNWDVIEFLACKISYYNPKMPPAPWARDFLKLFIMDGFGRVALSQKTVAPAWAFTGDLRFYGIEPTNPAVGVAIGATTGAILGRLQNYLLGRNITRTANPTEIAKKNNAFCAVVDMAAIILHELVHELDETYLHLSGSAQTYPFAAKDQVVTPPACDAAQSMMYYSFHVMMRDRYSRCLANSTNCATLGSRNSWMSGHGTSGTWQWRPI